MMDDVKLTVESAIEDFQSLNIIREKNMRPRVVCKVMVRSFWSEAWNQGITLL